MTAAVRERPGASARNDGGAPARRAIVRWAWRLFRREWRRQALILVMLVVAIAATIIGLGVASNTTNLKADPTFGTADTVVNLPGTDATLAADLAAIRAKVGVADVIEHGAIPIPGSVSYLDIRAQDPAGPYGHLMLRLDSGRLPAGPREVAVTKDAASDFVLHIGSVWHVSGQSLQVVGTVENPLNLLDQFALVAPGQLAHPSSVSVLVNASPQSLDGVRSASGAGLDTSSRGTTNKVGVEALVLVLGALGLLFVGLMAVAGFTVMAQRRLQAIGMLGSIGATDKHIRMVMLADGAAVGGTAAIAGTAVGIAGWFAFVPTLRSISEHRVDVFALPWWAIGAAIVLTFVTAVGAAWWPARAVSRISVMAALSGRPPRPQPAHRFAALGGGLLAGGLAMLAFAHPNHLPFILGGTVATAVGVLFLAPLAIRSLARLCSRSTIAVRLALRDLARYQARSGAALGAITLAIGIAATIAISASAAETPAATANLPTNELVVHLAPSNRGDEVVLALTAAQQKAVTDRIAQLAGAIHASSVLPLEQAYNPVGGPAPANSGPSGRGPSGYAPPVLARESASGRGKQISFISDLYVATPAVLSHYGISAAQVGPSADVISSRTDLNGLSIFMPGNENAPSPGLPARLPGLDHPTIRTVKGLPEYTSAPDALITMHALQTLGLDLGPAGWLMQTSRALTADQIRTARQLAAGVGVYVETHSKTKSLAPLRNYSTLAGILLALGVLGMTVGLIRSETASDLRTLVATGATSSTRRAVTGATAGSLALLGALLGTAGAYAALLAWHRSDLSPLTRIPVANLILIVIGLPVAAFTAGSVLTGREPAVISRRPLE